MHCAEYRNKNCCAWKPSFRPPLSIYLYVGEGDAEAAVAVPQRRGRLLQRQPGGPGVNHETVRNQGHVID